jgi:sugar phosphate isomerase/epimerase
MKKISEQIVIEASPDKTRRNFLKTVGVGVGALSIPGLGFSIPESGVNKKEPKVRSKEEKLKSMASNSYAVNQLFKKRVSPQRPENPENIQLKEKYGELTLLDFPRFTRDTYPGVKLMDLWSSLFGDITDDTMFTRIERNNQVRAGEFDPSSISSKRYLDTLVTKMVSAGISATHLSNNAPRNLADLDADLRKEGIRVGKLWIDAAKQIGVRSMRVNTGGPQIIPASVMQGGYPRNEEIVPYLRNAIESFKELADYGGKSGVKVTIENHWGLAANPVNIIIILNEVNSPYCEASPDFCNWEHEYMLYNALGILVPRATLMVHAKRWTRFPDVDIARCVRVLNDCKYKGYISVEYEGGGDPVAGTLKLLDDVVEALA